MVNDFSREAFNEIRELYSPYCSVAHFNLWRSDKNEGAKNFLDSLRKQPIFISKLILIKDIYNFKLQILCHKRIMQFFLLWFKNKSHSVFAFKQF